MSMSTAILQQAPTPRDAYKAAVKGEWTVVLEFYSTEQSRPINAVGDTLLHVLSLNHHSSIIQRLLDLSLPGGHDNCLLAKNGKGNTAVHEAVRVGSMEIVKLMVEKNVSLLSARNSLQETPIFYAAAYGREEILQYLYRKDNNEDLLKRDGDSDRSTILHAAVMGEFYGLALEIISLNSSLALTRNRQGVSALQLLAQLPGSFRSGTIYSWWNIGSFPIIPLQILFIIIYICIPSHKCRTQNKNWCTFTSGIKWIIRCEYDFLSEIKSLPYTPPSHGFGSLSWIDRMFLVIVSDSKETHNYANQLAKQLIKLQAASSITVDGTEINKPLLLATKHGIVELVDRILREFPEASYLSDENKRNMVHLAVESRSLVVMNFLKSNNFPMDRMVAEVDIKENTPLHLAAKLGEIQTMQMHGSYLKMSWEVFWYKALKTISLPQLLPLENSDGDTAEKLFNETHQKMLYGAELSVKNMSNTFSMITILIATINFQAAFTMPGGYDQNKGFPLYLHDNHTKADLASFVFYISAALFGSLVSLAATVSVNLSSFHVEDYFLSLPCKLFIGFVGFAASVDLTLLAYIEAIFLETNFSVAATDLGMFGIGIIMRGKIVTILVSMGLILSQIMFILVFVDIMYPFFNLFLMFSKFGVLLAFNSSR